MVKTSIHISFLIVMLLAFDTSAGWIQRADFGSHGRHRGASFAIGNKAYIGLGHYNGTGVNIVMKDWWEYDPATNAWTQKSDFIGGGVNGNYASLTFGFEEYGYITGGALGDLMTYRFDPTLNSWTPTTSCPVNPANTDGFVIGTKGYFVSSSNVYEFNSVTETWSLKNPAPFVNNAWNSAVSLGDKGYVKSGYTFWEYKPSIDSWAARATFPGLSRAASCSFTQGGRVYIVCGYASSLSDVNNQVWEYDPMLNSWTQLEDFPGNSRRFGEGINIGERAFIGIGTNGTNFNDFWEFDRYANLEEMFDINKFVTYPNPATDVIHFRSENISEFKIEIYNQLGRLITQLETQTGEITFNKKQLSEGTYYYQVIQDGIKVHSNQFIFN